MAAPVHDRTTTDAPTTAWTTRTYSHTVAGSDRYLRVAVGMRKSTAVSVSSITYNGVALSLIPSASADEGDVKVEVWGLVAPATGANNVVIILSANVNGVSAASSFTGVHQATPVGAPATGTGSSTGPTASVSTAAEDLMIDALVVRRSNNPNATAAPTSGAERFDAASGNSVEEVALAGSERPATGASVTAGWTLSLSREWALVGVALKPAAASGGTAASEGPNYADLAADESAGTANRPWTNLTNIPETDANALVQCGSMTSSTVSDYLKATDFDFSAVPDSATITGITVTIDRQAGASGRIFDNAVRLIKAGTVQTTWDNKASAATWGNTSAVATYGSSADAWGGNLTGADVKAAGFGVALQVTSNSVTATTAFVDYVSVTIDYTTVAAPATIAPNTIPSLALVFPPTVDPQQVTVETRYIDAAAGVDSLSRAGSVTDPWQTIAFAAANAPAASQVLMVAGTYTAASLSGVQKSSNVTFKPVTGAAVYVNGVKMRDCANLTFEGITNFLGEARISGGCDQITFRDCTFDSENALSTTSTARKLTISRTYDPSTDPDTLDNDPITNILFDGCTFKRARWTPPASATSASRGPTFCVIDASPNGVDGVTFQDCLFEDLRNYDCIQIQSHTVTGTAPPPSGYFIRDVIVDNCTFRNCCIDLALDPNSIAHPDVLQLLGFTDGVKVTRNTFIDSPRIIAQAVSASARGEHRNLLIENNAFNRYDSPVPSKVQAFPLRLFNAPGVKINHNTLECGTETRVDNATAFGTKSPGTSPDAATTVAEFHNNIVRGLEVKPGVTITSKGGNLIRTGEATGYTLDATDRSGTATYIDAAGNDFRPASASSPQVGIGSATGETTYPYAGEDRERNPRIGSPDAGAYEFVSELRIAVTGAIPTQAQVFTPTVQVFTGGGEPVGDQTVEMTETIASEAIAYEPSLSVMGASRSLMGVGR